MKKVLITTRLPEESFSELKEKFEVTMPEKIFSKEEVLSMIGQYDALIPTFVFKVDKDIIEAGAKSIKIIANYGAGYNNIDIEAATNHGIIVTNTPDPVIEPTAEQAMALMLAAARRIGEYDKKMRTPNAVKWGVMENLGQTVYGKTLGIIGMGNIGQAFARRAIASGMDIVYYNRRQLSSDLEQKYNATWVDLDKLFEISDVVSIHTPLTPETHHLINKERLAKMKSTAIIVNTARGPVIDEAALAEALKERRIYAAGLDVFENEPRVNPELLELDNVVLAPHNGTGTIEARIEIGHFAAQNILRFFEGRKDITKVN